MKQCFRRLSVRLTNPGKIGFGLVNFRIMSDRMSGKHFIKDFYLQFENNILSGNLSVGLVKKICLPDRMSGKNLNTFANTDEMERATCKSPTFTEYNASC